MLITTLSGDQFELSLSNQEAVRVAAWLKFGHLGKSSMVWGLLRSLHTPEFFENLGGSAVLFCKVADFS